MHRGALVNYEHVVDSACNTDLHVAEGGDSASSLRQAMLCYLDGVLK